MKFNREGQPSGSVNKPSLLLLFIIIIIIIIIIITGGSAVEPQARRLEWGGRRVCRGLHVIA